MARTHHHLALLILPRAARRAHALVGWTVALSLAAGQVASALQPTPADGLIAKPATQPTTPPATTPPATTPPASKSTTKPVSPSPGVPATKAPAKDNSMEAIVEFAVRQIARTCLADLRLIDEPTADDYKVAGLGLSIAAELAPGDADLLRKRIETAWNAGQADQARELTKQLFVLDPSDTVVLLRIITGVIGEKQTASDRLELYEKFTTGPKASAFDSALRSRLAIDAALLYRESGDEQGFRRMLRVATTTDSTNKEAAMLALTTFQQDRPGDIVGQFELLSNLLLADPLDAMVHLTMANELAANGSYTEAARYHKNGLSLIASAHAPAPVGSDVESLILDWQVKGPTAILDLLNASLETQRDKLRRYKASVTGIGEGLDVGNPEDLRLGPENEKVRFAASIATENAPSLTGSLLDMNRSVEFMFKIAVDDKKRPVQLTREEANRQANGALLDLQFWRVMAGLETERVEPDIAKFEGDIGKTQAGPDLVRAVLKVRQGEPEAAMVLLDNIKAQSTRGGMIWSTTQFGRGLAFEALERTSEAIAAYREAQGAVPMTPVGAMARSRADKLAGKVESPSPARDELTRLAESVPGWIDKMIAEPKSFITLLADMPPRTSAVEEAPLKVTLRNVAAIPLGLGTDRPINTRVMLAPVLNMRSTGVSSLATPEVFQLDRRLRLDKQESIQLTIHADWGFTSFLTELMCDQQSQIKWRLLQGFASKDSGGFEQGPHSLATDSSLTIRTGIEEARLKPAELAKTIASAEGMGLIRAFAAARRSLWTQEIVKVAPRVIEARSGTTGFTPTDAKPDPKVPEPKAGDAKPSTKPAPAAKPIEPPSAVTPATPLATAQPEPAEDLLVAWAADRATIAAALVAKYPSLSREGKLMLVAAMPHAGQFKEMEALDTLALTDSDPAVQAFALISRVKAADDPALVVAAKSSDPRLAQLASLLSARLTGTGPCYARLTPGLAAMRGDPQPLNPATPK